MKKGENTNHPEIDKEFLITNWLNTSKSLKDLSRELGVNDSLLESRAHRYGITKERKYSINTKKLFDFNNPNVWYLAGLIATDGYTNTNADFIAITLVGDSEKELLSDICKYFEMSSPVAEYSMNGKKKYSIRISAKGVKEFFCTNFGIPSKAKTRTVQVPKNCTDTDCLKAYILGCLDGDGCISHLSGGSPSVVLTTASEGFIRGVIGLIEENFGIRVSYSMQCGKYPTMGVYGKKKVLEFLNLVYSTSACLCLGRKREKYLLVRDIVCSTQQPK